MRSLHVKISDEVEAQLRKFTARKGDLSRLVEEALLLWLRRFEGGG
jgi:hypothetical protein